TEQASKVLPLLIGSLAGELERSGDGDSGDGYHPGHAFRASTWGWSFGEAMVVHDQAHKDGGDDGSTDQGAHCRRRASSDLAELMAGSVELVAELGFLPDAIEVVDCREATPRGKLVRYRQ